MSIATQDSQMSTQAIAEPQAAVETQVAGISEAAHPMPSEQAMPQVAARLAACPDTPNCVSTLATDALHAIEPMRYAGTQAAAQVALLHVLEDLPRATLITNEPGYIHMEYRSFLFRFVDDVEIVFDDAAKLIHFRAAARLGHSDLGVNRRRMEQIRRAFEQTGVG